MPCRVARCRRTMRALGSMRGRAGRVGMGVLERVVGFRRGRRGGTDDFHPGFLDVGGRIQ